MRRGIACMRLPPQSIKHLKHSFFVCYKLNPGPPPIQPFPAYIVTCRLMVATKQYFPISEAIFRRPITCIKLSLNIGRVQKSTYVIIWQKSTHVEIKYAVCHLPPTRTNKLWPSISGCFFFFFFCICFVCSFFIACCWFRRWFFTANKNCGGKIVSRYPAIKAQ